MAVMNFVEPYKALAYEKAPKTVAYLQRTGQWQSHLDEINKQAQAMLNQLLPDPNPGPAERQAAMEQVFAMYLEFPPPAKPETPEPPDDLGPKTGTGNPRPTPGSPAPTTS